MEVAIATIFKAKQTVVAAIVEAKFLIAELQWKVSESGAGIRPNWHADAVWSLAVLNINF